MSILAENIYKQAFRKHFPGYEANFPIHRKVGLGDYGVMRHGGFVRLGNIADEKKAEVTVVRDKKPSYEMFKSPGSVCTTSIPKITGADGTLSKPGFEIEFTETGSIFFSAAHVLFHEIGNIPALGQQLLQQYHSGNWKKEFYVVTRVVDASNALMVISGSPSCKIILETKTDVDNFDLTNAKDGFVFKSVRQTEFEFISEKECQIGLGFSRVYDSFFIRPRCSSRVELSAGLDYNNSTHVVFGDVLPFQFEEII